MSPVLAPSRISRGRRVEMNPHVRHPASAFGPFTSLWRHRELVWQMAKREVVGRYRGSVIGIAWSFFTPLLMLLVYTFVFSVVFKARWGVGGDESRASFAVVLFVGMIVHGLFAEVVSRAPGLILGNVSYVKRVVFPLEVLPWIAMGSAVFHACISLTALVLAQLFLVHQVPWTALLLPVVAIPLILGTMGLAWFLASLGVFLRDVGQAIGMFTTVLLFLSPVFYPVAILPEQFQRWMYLNPLTFIIEEARKLLLYGQAPDWEGCALYLAGSVAVAWAGFWWFQRSRNGFADVL
jgi:lipopolysaccharide transport system permease protein